MLAALLPTSWSGHPLFSPIAISLALLAVGVGLALWSRRRLRRHAADRPPLLLQATPMFLLLLVCLILLKLWTPHIAGAYLEVVQKATLSLVALLLVYTLVSTIRAFLLYRATLLETRHKIRRTTGWVGVLVFFISLAMIWIGEGTNWGVFFGIVGAGVALSMQETLLCVAGWVLLIFRKPFDIGDRIQVQTVIGDVIDIGVFHTVLLEVGNWVEAEQSTGRMIMLPNSAFFRHEMHNYTKGFPFIWNELPVTVTFESDWKTAKEILLSVAAEESEKIEREVNRNILQMQRQYAIHYQHLRPFVYCTMAPNGVKLTLRHLTPVRKRREVVHELTEKLLDAILLHPQIDLAYPTSRMIRNNEEGKPLLRPEHMYSE